MYLMICWSDDLCLTVVIALDVSVLSWLSGLDVLEDNTLFLSLFQQRSTNILRPIVNPNGSWFPPLFNDPIKATDHPFAWQGKVDFDTKTLSLKLIQHVQ